MKLDISHMRYLTADDYKVLTAVEIGTRNHEVVPTSMIYQIGGIKNQKTFSVAISDLAKIGLIQKLRNAKYDGYKLSHNGYDFLALKSMSNRETLYSMGTTIGVGKESDIFSVGDKEGNSKVLKIHRLGRTSFKTVKNNRDYLRNKKSSNWMYLSKLAANKEYLFMTTLYNNGFTVPEPFDYSRHCVMMEWIRGITMRALRKHKDHKKLYSDLMAFIVKLANHGLIHCDFNEFNIIIRDEEGAKGREFDFVVIDFPQCISIEHQDAEFYFDRDVDGIKSFFAKKFNYQPKDDSSMLDTDGFGEGYRHAYPNFKRDVKRIAELDIEVEASGFTKKRGKKEDKDLEEAVQSMREHEAVNSEDEEQELVEGEDEEEEDDEEYDEEYDEEEEEEENSDEEEDDEDDEENEKIIEALSSGVGNLKMDKFGNYILEE